MRRLLAAAVSAALASSGSAASATGTCGNPSKYFECPSDRRLDGGAWGNDRRRRTQPFPKACPNATARPWCDPSLPLRQRAERLVSELEFAELGPQVSCDIFGGLPAIERLGVNAYNFIRENNHGLLWNNICPTPTMFPQIISMAAAFNKSLWKAIGVASATETRYNYDTGKQNALLTQTNFNIFLDPRWGRGQEVPGESPYLNTAYARAWIRGVQAPKGPHGVPIAGTSCKHFAAYSFEGAGGWPDPRPDSNRHNFNAEVTAQDLADTHLPMFEACAEEGALGMMSSYNAINGVPMAANSALTNDVAREKFGFAGMVVTDCGAVDDIWRRHKYVSNASEAARAALEGGTDVECGNTIKESAQPDTEALMRAAVTRSMTARMALGEFNPPAADEVADAEVKVYDQAAHARLAYDAAVQSAVLLKNSGAVLPLKRGTRIALMGPLRSAKWELMGSYSAHYSSDDWTDAPNVVTMEQGLKDCELVGELVLPADNPGVCAAVDTDVVGTNEEVQKPDVDVVVVVAGLNAEDPQVMNVDERPYYSGKCQAGCMEGEGCDRPSLLLPPGQEQLLKRAASWGLPVVVVLVTGGPIDLSGLPGAATSSVLWMGYPGQAAGTALANLLFGRESPTGRLPQTFYRNSYLNHLSIKQMGVRPDPATGYPGRSFRFVDPIWVVHPFGHGLSYQRWSFMWTASFTQTKTSKGGGKDSPDDKWDECMLGVSAEMLGQSDHSSATPAATVLLFLRPPLEAGPSAPRRELRRFERVNTSPAMVEFRLEKKDFQLADENGNWKLTKGRWLAELGEPVVLRQELVVSANGCTAALLI